jgi:putative hemolysin
VIGLVTMVDVLEAIVGEIPTAEERMKPSAIQRPDGSWLVDGRHDVGKLTRLLAMRDFPGRDDAAEATLAALVATQLGGRIAEGATVETRGLRCEVIDLEGDRIRTLLVTKLPPP